MNNKVENALGRHLEESYRSWGIVLDALDFDVKGDCRFLLNVGGQKEQHERQVIALPNDEAHFVERLCWKS